MKCPVLLSVLACALGLPQNPSNRQGLFGGGFGAGFQSPNMQNWGPTAYGTGLNNPRAFPLNPIVMQRSVSLTETCPGTLVKVDVYGEITITDQYGFKVEIVDWMGNDVTEGITEFERPEPSYVIGGPPGFGGSPSFGGAAGGFSDFGGSQGFGSSPTGTGGQGGFGRPPCFRRPGFAS